MVKTQATRKSLAQASRGKRHSAKNHVNKYLITNFPSLALQGRGQIASRQKAVEGRRTWASLNGFSPPLGGGERREAAVFLRC